MPITGHTPRRGWRTARRLGVTVAVTAASVLGSPAVAHAEPAPKHPAVASAAAVLRVPTPKVRAIPGTPTLNEAGWSAPAIRLSDYGYKQHEFRYSGTATSFTATTPLSVDGAWKTRPDAKAKYATRMVVRTPKAAKFNGTVLVEWLNVSNNYDWDPEWAMMHEELMRDGYAWVGVSAQAAGINDLITNHASRYSNLRTPGDSFSYDIYSQAATAIRHDKRVTGGLAVRSILASGHSQSAIRMVTYLNGVAPLEHVYDGVLLHGRAPFGADLSQSPQPQISTPTGVQIRTDLKIPVLNLESETEVAGTGIFAGWQQRQPDSATFRLWESTGTAHVDVYSLGPDATVQRPSGCDAPINDGDHHYAADAALVALNRWVTKHRQPATVDRIALTSDANPVARRDENGLAEGGLRLPAVQVPTRQLVGIGDGKCALDGKSIAFSQAQLAKLYPTHTDYTAKVTSEAHADVDAGVLLPADATRIIETAMQSPIGS